MGPASATNPSSGNGDGAPARRAIAAPVHRSVPAPIESRQTYLTQLRSRLSQELVDRLSAGNLWTTPPGIIQQECRALVRALFQSEKGLLTSAEQERLLHDVMEEAIGLGPLEGLLKDPTITDILVNRFDKVYVERAGQLEPARVQFRDNQHLRQVIDRIVMQVGRRIDEQSPMVDARLADGSRVNAIIPPLALEGPALSIRRFGAHALTIEDLVRHGSIPAIVVDFLAAAVRAKSNILISGGTGSGKTTFLNCLSRYISDRERVITIEDAAELQLQQPHCVRLETRPPEADGTGEITQRDLVRNALRMRPDRIIIGEVRGPESLDMLQAMNTGHQGSMTTIHANSARDALSRLEVTVAMAGFDISIRALRQQIASAMHLVIQVQRLLGGKRKVVSISEITGMEGEQIQMHDLFLFEQTGVDQAGQAAGHFLATGIRPQLTARLEHFGETVPADWFARRTLG